MMINPRYIPIWEQIAELMADVPPEEFDKLPTDLSFRCEIHLLGGYLERLGRGVDYDASIEARLDIAKRFEEFRNNAINEEIKNYLGEPENQKSLMEEKIKTWEFEADRIVYDKNPILRWF